MRKALCVLAAAAMMSFSAKADEGMWLLPLIQEMNADAIKDLGCRLTPEQIYSINNSSLKDAIVHFGGGCTGEMISKEGLLVTNHHCGYSSIQGLSTPEHNYLEDGYWAMDRSQELPVPGLSVTFLESMVDVTDIINKADDPAKKRQELAKEAEADYPGCRVSVVSFYNSNVYYLIVSKVYRDIRFVGAPPASLGKFGGETDNWMWPRHTCDFSMFRVYAGKDNQPAAYSEENVPYVPKQALKISLKGVNEGDYAMIMGYPGSTQRFQTADQLEAMMARFGISVKARTVRQDIMWAGMEADPKVRLQYANKYASSSNAWKKWQGEQLAFDKLNIIGRERQKEADFMAWVGKNKKRQEKYGSALADISAYVAETTPTTLALTTLTESVYRIGPVGILGSFSRQLNRNYQRFAAEDSLEAVKATLAAGPELFKDYNEPLEREIAVAMLEFYRDNAKPENYIEGIGDFATMDFKKYVDDLFDNSYFASEENFSKLTPEKITEINSDPVFLFDDAMMKKLTSFYGARGGSEKLAEATKAFTAGLLEWEKGKPSYPDANSTMRLTYGTVKPYSPKDGVSYWHYTTLAGVMEKEDPDNYEFRVPAKLKELYKAQDYGQYANAAGQLPTCFLTNNDITGGNSGSPVLNADGHLIGLAFDGNWESMSSDVMFEPDLQRCISVDIRYVLFIMDKFGGAGHLLDEMEIVR